MSLLAKKFKREHFPVPEAEGLFVRPLKNSENRRGAALVDDADKVWFTIGIVLTDAEGSPLFAKSPEETDQQFADRVRIELDEADFDNLLMSKVCDSIGKVSTYNPETIRKN